MSGHASSRRALALAVLCSILAAEPVALGQKKFIFFGESKVSYKSFRDPAGRFEIDYPTKDWGSFPAGGSTIAILSRNDRSATIVVDLARLSEPLAESEIATNAQIETDSVKEQQPTAKDFTSEMLESKAGHGSLIRYSRIGTQGAERVMRYLVGVDRDLYRVDAVVPDAALARFEPILLHMITSFKAPAGPAVAKH